MLIEQPRQRTRSCAAKSYHHLLAPALASAKGWLAYQMKAGTQDRVWLMHPDGSDDHQAFPNLPGRTLHPDFSGVARQCLEQRLVRAAR